MVPAPTTRGRSRSPPVATPASRAAAASTPPAANRAPQGAGPSPVPLTPLASGTGQGRGRFLQFSPTYDPEMDREGPTLGSRLSTFDRQVSSALGDLTDQVNEVAGRLVGVEAAHQSLRSDARAALDGLLVQARSEFERQEAALVSLCADIQQEAMDARGYMGETRLAVERIYAGARGEFATLQSTVREDRRALEELKRQVAGGNGIAPPQPSSAPADPGSSDP